MSHLAPTATMPADDGGTFTLGVLMRLPSRLVVGLQPHRRFAMFAAIHVVAASMAYALLWHGMPDRVHHALASLGHDVGAELSSWVQPGR